MHLPSHWFSCGQTRPQMAGSMSPREWYRDAAEVLRADLLDKAGDVDVDGAALNTERLLAVEAALGLGQRHLLGEALVDGAEVAGALGSRLLVIGGAGRLHIGNETAVN